MIQTTPCFTVIKNCSMIKVKYDWSMKRGYRQGFLLRIETVFYQSRLIFVSFEWLILSPRYPGVKTGIWICSISSLTIISHECHCRGLEFTFYHSIRYDMFMNAICSSYVSPWKLYVQLSDIKILKHDHGTMNYFDAV